ncbi:Bug family tripartite tricarboxylate transporter substrate binding protein [Variovorax sp. RA8]|uniref:Bug family tripartite tricarboxylate transporter substrate binding protein n=1 Tax=Variovorax sp. (strain JCM 16519 / RA8) TaxID=662548 RepID=UPI00131914E0|nr:tripartite tricarboxylate transporter substrate binding protein [Variovorax sp. RA8]VTU42012.1 Argininosuccinate lyase [Variovorax sp. RA8]
MNRSTPLGSWRTRIALVALVALLVLAVSSHVAAQQAWAPSKPVRLVVPYPAGGGTDIAARLVAAGMGTSLGQAVVVDNKPGANGVISADYVYAAVPDATTLLFGSADVISISPFTYPKIQFQPNGFSPVAPIAKIGVVLAARADIDAKTLPELVAKSKTKEYSYAHWGPGSNGRIGMEIFQSHAGSKKMLGVSYLGTAPALVALLSGQVDLMLVPTPLVIANRSRLVIYGIASPERFAGLKDVPTLAELGYPVDANIWFGVLAPPKTPQPAIDVIQAEMTRVVHEPATQARMIELGLQPDLSDPRGFAGFVLSENNRWGAVIKAAGIKIE